MGTFIVISSDERLHFIVDGIEKCRPHQVDVPYGSGKIYSDKNGSYYTYTGKSQSENTKLGAGVSLSKLLTNQIAMIRSLYNMKEDDRINIFYLESPYSDAEHTYTPEWLDAFREIYDNGKGKLTNFCLWRIVFAYDVSNPTDVYGGASTEALRSIMGQEEKFNSYTLFIDNQNLAEAAICLSKADHDLAITRLLTDFMMLASSDNDKYDVFQAFGTERCCTLGFAECAYFYQDVERYFEMADLRDLQREMLRGDDEAVGDTSKAAMDIERKPFGLHARKNRLKEIYSDIPFDKDIAAFEHSADKIIDDHIRSLKPAILEKYAEDEAVCRDIETLETEINSLKLDVASLEAQLKAEKEAERIAEIKQQMREKEASVKMKQKEAGTLKQKIKDGVCPPYVDRREIFEEYDVLRDTDLLIEKRESYKTLLNYVKGKVFFRYLKDQSSANPGIGPASGGVGTPSGSRKLSWWRRFLNWLFGRNVNNESTLNPTPADTDLPASAKSGLIGDIAAINEQLELKTCFKSFLSRVTILNAEYDQISMECDKFELSSHSHLYKNLTVRDKLMHEQQKEVISRISDCRKLKRQDELLSRTDLIKAMKRISNEFTNVNYLCLDWNKPFDFVDSLHSEEARVALYNRMVEHSYPFVNYDAAIFAEKPDMITYALYSNRPDFCKEVEDMKEKKKLEKSTDISARHSRHIESKICAFQFFPMDEKVLGALVRLK